MKVQTVTMAFAVLLSAIWIAHTLGATTYTLREAVSGVAFDWQASESYEEGGAPSADDTVATGNGETVFALENTRRRHVGVRANGVRISPLGTLLIIR